MTAWGSDSETDIFVQKEKIHNIQKLRNSNGWGAGEKNPKQKNPFASLCKGIVLKLHRLCQGTRCSRSEKLKYED